MNEIELQQEIHDISFRLRSNSIGTRDLKLDGGKQEKEINEHLSYYEELFRTVFEAYHQSHLDRVVEKLEESKVKGHVSFKYDHYNEGLDKAIALLTEQEDKV